MRCTMFVLKKTRSSMKEMKKNQWKTLYIKHSKTTRWLKLTRQDKTCTQVIIHWIKDLHLESVH